MSFGERCAIDRLRSRRHLQRGSGVRQLSPAFPVVVVSDPDIEIGVDPGAGEDAGQFTRGVGAPLCRGHGLKLGMAGEPAIERPEKWAPTPREMLPRIFPVQDDRDQRFSPAGTVRVTPTALHQPKDEVFRGRFGVPALPLATSRRTRESPSR